MAPEQAGTKRKRGRPPASASHASAPSPPAPNAAAGGDAGEDDAARPKKRGRKPKAPVVRQDEEATVQPEGDARQKQQDKARTSRRRGAETTEPEADANEEGVAPAGRPGRKRKARDEPEPATHQESADKPSSPAAAATKRKTASAGASTQRASPDAHDDSVSKKKRGRKPKQPPEPAEDEGEEEEEAERPEEEEDEEEQQHQEEGRQSRGNQTRESSLDDESDSDDLPAKPYPHVTSIVRGIRQSTIDAKWTALGGPSIAAATETLELAHRPILQRLTTSEQRRQHTSSALAVLYRRITRKLHKGLPFPPATASAGSLVVRRRRRGGGDGGRELELDFERVLDAARALERQLDPALHAVELLGREKDRLERELERDYKTLQNLEAGARGQSRQQREQLKKAHVLTAHATAPRASHDVELAFDKDQTGAPGGLFKDLTDEDDFKELALQLGGHVESIRANLQQTEGLVPQLNLSKAALRRVLHQHLNQAQNDKVLLG